MLQVPGLHILVGLLVDWFVERMWRCVMRLIERRWVFCRNSGSMVPQYLGRT